ncbi:hypothetical protein F66182_7467 [Fusarium sp. NRRL 66182]|nr:hypothetical protein F66182_7467 [Fusarium sp. NRRL 66182]
MFTSRSGDGATLKAQHGAKFEKSLASKPFLFIIGPKRNEFHVHKELIGQLSPALNALVNGNMKEACEGRVEWPDLDVDTFVRFAKFAYSGDYTEADPDFSKTAIANAAARVPTPNSEAEGQKQTSNLTGREDDQDEYSDDNDDPSSDSGRSSESSNGSDEVEGEDSSSSDGSSQLEAQALVMNPFDSSSEHSSGYQATRYSYAQTDQWGFLYRTWTLPLSVNQYMGEWEHYVESLRCQNAAKVETASRTLKRKRLEQGAAHAFHPPTDSKYEAMNDFSCHPYSQPASGAVSTETPLPSWEDNSNGDVSHLPALLSHARLYILADKYDVEDLRRLALRRLHALLHELVLFPQRISDIVALAQEIFTNTVEQDDAREIIVKYFACFIEHIRDSPELVELLGKGGDFPAALIEKMALRLR